MKKNQLSSSHTQDPIYATVKPRNERGSPTRDNSGGRIPELEAQYAEMQIRTQRGQHTKTQEDVIYADVQPRTQRGQHTKTQEDVIYADVQPRTQRGQHTKTQEDVIYADVRPRTQREPHHHKPEETVYAQVSTGSTPTSPRSPKDQMTVKFLQNVDIQYGAIEVQEWCKVVYGDQHALNNQLAKMLENPQQAENFARNIMANPEDFGKLAGRAVLGIKSPQRKEAENGFPPLCDALERHAQTLKKLHRDLTREHSQHKGIEKEEKSPERRAHRHHYRAKEESQTGPKQEQPRKDKGHKIAFAM
ncbi:BID domain-containing T4SS effector [Bartonella doshiae]|uniref:BID domain-containing T4SS effector n=1 Tax=Bartonella doshiae TaxID=33044 RepID=UPI001ABAA85E|nr:BID domain-containing T4SS effector [Bartonella doshiae]